jgi:hypothetical protein
MEGFSSVTPVTGLNRPNTGKEYDADDTLNSDRKRSYKSKFVIHFTLGSQLEHRARFGVSMITHTKTHGRNSLDE